MHKNSRQTATGGCPMHRRSGYYVRGDAEPCKPGNPLENPTDVPAPEALSPYCRIFEPKPTQPEDERLIALGKTMRDDGSQASVNANIPAGYTYLGQFKFNVKVNWCAWFLSIGADLFSFVFHLLINVETTSFSSISAR